jgi:hypothetical protein
LKKAVLLSGNQSLSSQTPVAKKLELFKPKGMEDVSTAYGVLAARREKANGRSSATSKSLDCGQAKPHQF